MSASRADSRRIFSAAFFRATATAMGAVLLGLHLAEAGLDAAEIGIVVSAGLAGNAGGALLLGLLADRIGRRRTLRLSACLAAAGALAVALVPPFPALVAAAFLGLVNGMGRDRGPAYALEQAVLPRTTEDRSRTRVFAGYTLIGEVGHAFGSLAAGLPAWLRGALRIGRALSFRIALLVSSAMFLGSSLAYRRLPPETDLLAPRRPMSARSRRIVFRLAGLFALDSTAGGFLTNALLAYWFFHRFGVNEVSLGLLFLGARVANAVSYLAAARLAERIGLLRAMVFTHLPSNVALMAVPLAPDFFSAAALFLLRELLVEMDVPTRQSYAMALVGAEERPYASGVTNFVRTAGWSLGSALAGYLTEAAASAPLFVGGAVKIVYDLALFASFRRVLPPEEVARAGPR